MRLLTRRYGEWASSGAAIARGNGEKQSGGSRKASNYRELRPALSICGAKTKARGEGGSRSTPACGEWLGPGKKETVAFDSRTLGAGWRGAGSLHPSEGSYLAPKTWARPPKTLQSFSLTFPSPLSFPCLWRVRAGSPLPHFLLGAKSGGGKKPDTKAHARPLPPRQGVAGERLCSLRCGSGARVCLLPRLFVVL